MNGEASNPKGPPAVDRRTLAREALSKTSRWPWTDRRVARLDSALRHRQIDFTVVLENVHDTHNISAVLRTCDAIGIQTVHMIYTAEDPPQGRFARRVSAGTAKWIDCVQWESVEGCYAALRNQGLRVLATAFTDTAISIFEEDLTQPVAVIFGNEMRGLSEDATSQADGELFIPMVGMVQSLNISVSCAVTLYEAYRQRVLAGAYDQPTLSDDVIRRTLEHWLKR